QGPRGSQPAAIQAPNNYIFTLYADATRTTVLGSAPVTTILLQGDISADPNPVIVPPGQLGTTTITWSTTPPTFAQVWVRVNDDPTESLFASGTSGSQPAPWIQGG